MRYGKLITATALASAVAATAQADVIGAEFGAYRWQADFDGEVRADGGDRLDINNTLGIDDDDIDVIFLALEHPIPLLPNIRLQHTRLDTSGTTVIGGAGFTFDGRFYPPGQTVHTSLDLTHTDATFYYELLDNIVSLDAGITIRYFDGGVELRSLTGAADLDFDHVLPMLYLAGRVELPMGFYAGADFNGIGISDSNLLDYRVRAGWESAFGLGLELGMRRFDLDYDDDDDEADVTADGIYGQVFLNF